MPVPHKFEEGDQVTVKKGARSGQRAVITEIRFSDGSLRLRFADDKVLPYGPNEVEPASMPRYSEGDLVRHQGDRFRIKESCPHNAGRWHLADRKNPTAIVRCGHERDMELLATGDLPMASYLNRKVQIREGWASHAGKVGVVKKVFPDSQLTRVAFGDGKLHTYHREHLELLDEEPEPQAKGDEVIVTATGSKWHGWRGNVKHRFSTGMVDIDFGSGNVGTVHEQHLQFTTPAVEAKPDKPVRLIGVTGHKRAGKDTFAKRLVEEHGFTRMAFADNVRKVALAINPLVAINGVDVWRLSQVVALGGWEFAKELPEVRQILQRIGTEGIRSLDDGFWIRQVLDHLPDGPVVITDVRFRNEADAIKAAGGIVVRIDRPGLVNDDQHISESAMDDYRHDEVFQNRGTIKDLYALVDKWVADGFPTV